MFPMTVTLHNHAQLNAVLAAMNLEVEPPKPAAAQVEAPKQEKNPAGTAPTAEAKQTVTTEAAESPKTESVAAEAGLPAAAAPAALDQTAEQPATTYQETAAAVTGLAKAKGRAAAMDVLKAFGVEKLPDAKPEQFAAIIAAAMDVLKAGA